MARAMRSSPRPPSATGVRNQDRAGSAVLDSPRVPPLDFEGAPLPRSPYGPPVPRPPGQQGFQDHPAPQPPWQPQESTMPSPHPSPPQQRPGSHRHPGPQGGRPLPPESGPPVPRGRHRAPDPPNRSDRRHPVHHGHGGRGTHRTGAQVAQVVLDHRHPGAEPRRRDMAVTPVHKPCNDGHRPGVDPRWAIACARHRIRGERR